ncbi:hypothetical protein AABB24_002501 [Solanum stoloniferum]|uniref:Uncharacterized protein n=1 Tax=Solanum stoloniferum TaxID=62892 RepID=A0ABD2VPX9_9SOLN
MKSNSISSTTESTPNYFQVDYHVQEGSVSTSSISEYLTETLPGWHVEDFLEYPSSSSYGKCFFFYGFNLYSPTIMMVTPFAEECHTKYGIKLLTKGVFLDQHI